MLKLLIFSVIATPAMADSITPSQGLSAITDAIRSGAKEVHFSKGVFLFPKTLTLSAKVNGVRFIGSGDQTLLSGARKAGPWELVDRKNGLWRCKSPLQKDGPVRQLFAVGEGRLPRSRMPNQGWFRGD